MGDKNLELVDLKLIECFPDKLKGRSIYLFLTSFNKTKYFQIRYPNIYKKLKIINKIELIKFGNDDSLYKIE